MIRKKRIGNEGFSIVEAMAAIVMLSIIFIPITNSFINSVKASQETKIMQAATNTAQQVMEDFKRDTILNLSNRYTLTSPMPADWTTVEMSKSISKADNDCCDFTVDIKVSKTAATDSLASGINDINNVEMNKVFSMSAPSSSVLNIGEIPYVVSEKILGAGSVPVEESDLQVALHAKGVKRKIIIHISKDSASGNTKIVCEEEFTPSTGTTYKYFVNDTLLSTKLKTIYVYAKGLYGGGADDLEIKNDDRIEANVYLVYDLPGYMVNVTNDSTNLSYMNFVSNVVCVGKINKSVSTDAQYIVNKGKEDRRYEVTVTVTKDKGVAGREKVYSKLVSTRGE